MMHIILIQNILILPTDKGDLTVTFDRLLNKLFKISKQYLL